MMLADMGADVLRIDRIGDADLGLAVDPRFCVLERGRRSVAMDLKTPAAVAAVKRLIAQADALIEGFRPGVMERLGLGPDDCLAANPRLVYGRMTGWGQDGPMAAAAGHDINYIALAGVLHSIGRKGGAPGAAAQPRRRLRRRRHVPRVRHRVRAPRGEQLRAAARSWTRPWSTARRRWPPPCSAFAPWASGTTSAATTSSTRARPGTTCTRRRTASTSPSAPSRSASTASCSASPGSRARPCPRSGTRRAGRELRARLTEVVQAEDARRVVRAHGGHRRLLRARAVHGRGAARTRTIARAAPSSRSTAWCSPRPAPRFSRSTRSIQRPPARARRAHRRGARRLGLLPATTSRRCARRVPSAEADHRPFFI